MRRVNDVARHTLPRLEAMRWNDKSRCDTKVAAPLTTMSSSTGRWLAGVGRPGDQRLGLCPGVMLSLLTWTTV